LAGSRKPGPLGRGEFVPNIQDGTFALGAFSTPGPIGHEPESPPTMFHPNAAPAAEDLSFDLNPMAITAQTRADPSFKPKPMLLQISTREFLSYLQQNPDVRQRIKADKDKTLLYAGRFFGPIWKELEVFQREHPGSVQILPEVLQKIPAPFGNPGTLKNYVDTLTSKVPKKDRLIIWRALSGIFASNADGTVYFSVGSEVDREEKVFASTEILVLARNQGITPESRAMVEYYQRCVREKKTEINMGFMPEGV
jgi:hypothetical protein